MAKVDTKAITRIEKFLKAIAGDDVAPDPITDLEKLLYNIAENVNAGGSSSGGPFVITNTNGTLDKTWQEIYDAISNATICVISHSQEDGNSLEFVTGAYLIENMYVVEVASGGYSTDSANGYPVN